MMEKNISKTKEVTMELGGTFLNVIAYHKNSNTNVNMEFKCNCLQELI